LNFGAPFPAVRGWPWYFLLSIFNPAKNTTVACGAAPAIRGAISLSNKRQVFNNPTDDSIHLYLQAFLRNAAMSTAFAKAFGNSRQC
jgi:hypothetical protein